MNGNTGRTQAWLWLTVPIAISLTIAAGGGLFVDGLYRDTTIFAVQAVGQDLITLAVAIPVLIISAILASRGSHRARIIWMGVLVYLVYSYTVAAFMVRFNPLFLVYVALFGCSLYALIGGIATTDLADIKARFTEKTPVKAVSIFLAVLVVFFYSLWLSEIVPALIMGNIPQSVIDTETPTNAIHVLDMAWLLPAMGLSSFWLWRKRELGYTLAGALLTFVPILGLAIMSMILYMKRYDQPVSTEQTAIFGIVSAVGLGMLIWYLKGLRES
ncbi:hypothetical protein ACFL4Z_01285 [candidate division KSB1 bacterium]